MKTSASRQPLIEVRHSPVHGYGVFALRRIRKGTTVMEYLGERVSHEEADARYEDKDPDDNHTFLFTVDSKTVIDGGVDGNDARFINHSCDPNCESATHAKRIYIEAVRTIQPGEELAYDYQIDRDPEDPPNVDEIFACRCGTEKCRGSMLVARKKPRKKKTAAKTGRKKSGLASRSKSRPASRSKSERSSRAQAAGARSGGTRSAAARKTKSRPAKTGAAVRRQHEVERRGKKSAASRRRGR